MNISTGEWTALQTRVDDLDQRLVPKLNKLAEQLDELLAGERPRKPVQPPPLEVIPGGGKYNGRHRRPQLSLVPPHPEVSP